MALDLFSGPIQAPDVIVESGLYSADVGGAETMICVVRVRHSGPRMPTPGSRSPSFGPPCCGGWFGNGWRVSGATLIGDRVAGVSEAPPPGDLEGDVGRGSD